MAHDHPTVVPEQRQTDTYEVVAERMFLPGPTIVGEPDVPRYSLSNEDGNELSEEKRKAMAVKMAVDANDNFDPEMNASFRVRKIGSESLRFVEYEDNPTIESLIEEWEEQ